ncbi:MAG: hypothetical protein ACSW8G_02545 [Bacillota bacterium]
MENNPQDNRYEQLYEELRSRAAALHQRNKDMIKYGSIGMIVLPVILFTVRWLTDSDKMVFLLIWILCLFALAAFLIGVEYLDSSIQKTLREMTDREEEFDDLLGPHKRLPGRIAGKVAGLKDRVDAQERMKLYGIETDERQIGEDGDDSE